LHVLSTPPAFVLSQDQTLRKKLQPTPESVSELILTVDCLLTIFNPKGIVSDTHPEGWATRSINWH
jgi:hypothetical protein